jgi:hypothetical protein
MKAFDTGNPAQPTIYLSHDDRHVLVLTMNRSQGVSLHRATLNEIEWLAKHYNLPQLLQAARQYPC